MLGLAIVPLASYAKTEIMLKQHTAIIGEYFLNTFVQVFYTYCIFFSVHRGTPEHQRKV